MATAMVICPHADDAAAFCGATLAKFAHQGWKIVLVRVTDDCTDAVGLTMEEAIKRNTEQLHAAAKILGVSEIIELGYKTDSLADISLVELRGKLIYLFRKHRPYAVFSFDPFGINENNQDHVRVAQAVDEAFWTSTFDLHYPEHFEEGLEPFSVCERWYYGRNLPGANHAEDVSDFIETKVDAMCAHREMMRNTVNQMRLQLKTWGRRVPMIDAAVEEGNLRPLLALAMQEQANAVAKQFELGPGRMGEVFRLDRFGDFEPMMQTLSEPIEGAYPPPRRERLDAPPVVAPDEKEAGLRSHMLPKGEIKRLPLMGHHHLCAGAFEELFELPAFRAAYGELADRVKPSPDLIVQSVFGYDTFCYICEYWSDEEGRCSTGWRNKITKDAAVLECLGLHNGSETRLEDLHRLLAEKVSPEQLHEFCGPGEWKCELYMLGVCRKAFDKLRAKYGPGKKTKS